MVLILNHRTGGGARKNVVIACLLLLFLLLLQPSSGMNPTSRPPLGQRILAVPMNEAGLDYSQNGSRSEGAGACEVPCWRGLTPGIATADEAIATVRNSAGYRYVESESYGKTIDWVEWLSGNYATDGSGAHTKSSLDSGSPCEFGSERSSHNSMDISNGLLERLILFDEPAVGSSLEEIVDKYGPPERAIASFYSAGGGDLSASFLYPSKGLGFFSDFSPDTYLKHKKVTEIWYFAPMTWDEYKARFMDGAGEGYQDWQDFKAHW